MTGRNILHYEILDKLGEGGMGVVYKARDPHLGRFVAIKCLIAGHCDSLTRRARFIQEGRAASALNHPNIITIYDIITAGEDEFIVMEFIRGKTLGELIETNGIPNVDCLRFAMQIADALAAAHEVGIIHRDLKPANVMVTQDGIVKVLDFGLARISGDAGGILSETDKTPSIGVYEPMRTPEGTILGTVAYMSPEQARGEKLDARSDIFAFGALLYEMVAGEGPFHREIKIETLTAILRDNPAQLTQSGAEAPPALQEIIFRCLRKDPDQRYQSMQDVKSAIEQVYIAIRIGLLHFSSGAWKMAASLRPAPSIAVLPFLNLSADQENEYFSDGLAEEIINALSKVKRLRVVARTSAFLFRGAQRDIGQIGETLRVSTVLEGSVRKAGNRVRVSVHLIDVADGTNLWSESFDRQMTDVFEIQDQISRAIVEKLKVKLPSSSGFTPDPSRHTARLVKRRTANLEAYNLYLRGRFELYKMSREGFDASNRMFREAIRLDPKYALAYAGLAYCLYQESFMGFVPPKTAMPGAKAMASRAIELDERLSEAHATLGVIYALYDWDWAGAERELTLGMELKGASPVARDDYAFFYLRPLGRIEEALQETLQALSGDPLSTLFQLHLGFLYYLQRKYDQSIAQLRNLLVMSPQYYLAHALMGNAYTLAGQFDEALCSYTRAKGADAGSKFVDSLQAMTLGFAGRTQEALALLNQITRRAADDYISPVSIAYIYTALGDKDRAFENLGYAVSYRDPNIVGLKSNPIFDSLRGDKRYQSLLKKMRLDGKRDLTLTAADGAAR